MLKKFTKDFGEFLNESADYSGKGLPFSEFMPLFSQLVEMCPNLTGFTYPSDIHAHSSRHIEFSRDGKFDPAWMKTKEEGLSEMEKDLQKIETFYADREMGTPSYYIWAVYTKGFPSRELEKRLAAIGGMPKVQDFKIEQLIELLENDSDLLEAVTSISVSMDSESVKSFGAAMSRGEYGSLD